MIWTGAHVWLQTRCKPFDFCNYKKKEQNTGWFALLLCQFNECNTFLCCKYVRGSGALVRGSGFSLPFPSARQDGTDLSFSLSLLSVLFLFFMIDDSFDAPNSFKAIRSNQPIRARNPDPSPASSLSRHCCCEDEMSVLLKVPLKHISEPWCLCHSKHEV